MSKVGTVETGSIEEALKLWSSSEKDYHVHAIVGDAANTKEDLGWYCDSKEELKSVSLESGDEIALVRWPKGSSPA